MRIGWLGKVVVLYFLSAGIATAAFSQFMVLTAENKQDSPFQIEVEYP